MEDLEKLRSDIQTYINLRLGGGIVEVELDPAHYNECIDQAIRRYRQRAARSEESSYLFLDIIEDQQEYVLPDEVELVRQVFRRTVGSSSSSGATNFEPFEAGFVNTYLLQAGRVGGLASYELYYQYQELSARLFGGWINFEWNPVTKTITLLRKFNASGEQVVLWVYNAKPEVVLLKDKLIYPWIQDYALALCKFSLGEARSKYATIAGPQGGTSLNGDALKNEGAQEMETLEEELKNYVDGSDPLSFRIS